MISTALTTDIICRHLMQLYTGLPSLNSSVTNFMILSISIVSKYYLLQCLIIRTKQDITCKVFNAHLAHNKNLMNVRGYMSHFLLRKPQMCQFAQFQVHYLHCSLCGKKDETIPLFCLSHRHIIFTFIFFQCYCLDLR